jgi:hypothetical protein
MATKNAKPAAAPATRAAANRRTSQVIATPVSLATPEAGIPQRLLREAAWSRMFGRADVKNPFARSR